MKKYTLPPLISITAAFTLTHENVPSGVTSFLIAGIIPGTEIALPFWAMMLIYCITISAIVTFYIEATILRRRKHTSAPVIRTQQHLPHRRFSAL